MNLNQLLTELSERNVKIWAEGEHLRIRAPKGALTSELRDSLTQCKTELLTLLHQWHITQQAASLPLVPIPRNGNELPLSFAQQRLWFLSQIEDQSVAYNIPVVLNFSGPLDAAVLERCLDEILRRHEALRTSFPIIDGSPVQQISLSQKIPLNIIDLALLSDADQRKEVRRLATEEAQRPFDLASGPLIRTTLLQLGEASHVFLLTTHHIISDGWSVEVFVREAAVLYDAFSKGAASPLPDLPVQYADFAYWQRKWLAGDVLERQLAYWKQQLAGALPLLALPVDRPRPNRPTFEGATHPFTLSPALTESLKRFSRQEGVTLFAALLAAFKTLLYRYSGQEDILVGSPIANRNRPELEPLIGFFVNTLVLRSELSGNPSLRELVNRVRRTTLDAYRHQDIPFEKLVEELQPDRNLGHHPLFQVMFVLQNSTVGRPEHAELHITPIDIDTITAKFDLIFFIGETPQGLVGRVEYTTDLFDRTTISRMTRHFTMILEALAAFPESQIAELAMLTEDERDRIVIQWNDTHAEYSHQMCIHHLFEIQAEQTPDAPAVIFEDQQLTYQELNARANRLTHHLRAIGVGPEVLVGVYCERSADMIVGLLGILKSGGAYVPLDPHWPTERIHQILSSLATPYLITQQSLLSISQELFRSLSILTNIICLDAEIPDAALPAENPDVPVNSDNTAYIIFTSGSTGVPKGVVVRHKPVINLIEWVNTTFDVNRSDRLLFMTSLCFDLSVYDIFGSLAAGASIYVVSEAILKDPEKLTHALCHEGITFWDSAPAALQQLVPFFPATLLIQENNHLRLVFLSGDWIPVTLPDNIRGVFPEARVTGLGGATEATIWSNYYPIEEVQPRWPSIPYGTPIHNARYYILDAYFQPCPIGVAGDLYIGGECLASGYINDPEQTAERFLPDPFNLEPGARFYKTGDIARYFPDGNIEFLGRIDHQVKIRGFRIELGEIETVLARHPAIREAVILVRETEENDRRLIAYVTPGQSVPPAVNELQKYLKERLPEYMLPSAFIILDAIPITPNGKIDRSALRIHDISDGLVKQTYVAPRTPIEKMLANLCTEVLEIEHVGVHDNFFELGGHSLLMTQLLTRMRGLFQIELPLQGLFESPTISHWAGLISAIQRGEPSTALQEMPVIDLQQEASLDSDICPETPATPMYSLTHPQHIFLTGTTGFLGAFLLSELLQQTEADISCLVRSTDDQDGAKRIQSTLESYALWSEHFTSRIIPVPGDLSQPLFGLSPEQFDRLARRTEIIYHCGALVNFVYPYSALKAANVLGTHDVLRLACQHHVKPVHYISTISVFDSTGYSGEKIILEDEPLAHSDGLRNGYAQSKWVAENLVTIARSRGLPVAIYRPGRITGHRQTGIGNTDDFTFHMIRACIQLGSVPSQNIMVDMTPVDYVSQAITYLSTQPDSLGQVFHLVNPQPLHWDGIVKWLRSFGSPLQQLPYDQWLESLIQLAKTPSEDPAFQTLLPMFLDSEAHSPEERPPQFDCRKTLSGLAKTSITCPPVNANLLEAYRSYFLGFVA